MGEGDTTGVLSGSLKWIEEDGLGDIVGALSGEMMGIGKKRGGGHRWCSERGG